ncbi:copper chaperone PCu(A)C [Geodermatophilus sp. SYSU D00814]
MRRGLAAAGAALVLLVGCDAGKDAATETEAPATAGVNAQAGSVQVVDAFLDTSGTVPAGGDVDLRAALVNDGDEEDRLVTVSTAAAASVELLGEDGAPAAGGIPVPAGGTVDATSGPVRLRLTGLTEDLPVGQSVPVTFEFAVAGDVAAQVPVGTS